MHNMKYTHPCLSGAFILALAAVLHTGCQSNKTESSSTQKMATPSAPAAVAATAPAVAPPASPAPAQAAEPVPTGSGIRIKAGSSAAYKDSNGNVWLPDQGFDGGEIADR